MVLPSYSLDFDFETASIAHGSGRSGRQGHRRDYGLADGSVEPNLLAVSLHARRTEAEPPDASRAVKIVGPSDGQVVSASCKGSGGCSPGLAGEMLLVRNSSKPSERPG